MSESTNYQRRNFLKTIAAAGSAVVSSSGLVNNATATEPAAAAPPGEVSITPDLNRLRTFLVLDRLSMADADGATFHLNPAQKRPENPVLLPGEPQEWDGLQVSWPGTVLYDANEKLFRCWYNGLDAVQKNRPPRWVPGYAESTDGVHWTKPRLGQYSHNGEDTNRILVDFSTEVISLVVANPDRNDPERRFLAHWQGDDPATVTMVKKFATSPDGKKWKYEGIAMLPDGPERDKFIDLSSIIFQPDAADENDRVLAYGQLYVPRAWDPRFVRQIGLARGASLGSVSLIKDLISLGPEQGIDEENHFASVSKVGDKFLMLFESDRFSQKPLHGDLRLAVSNDGRNFRRVHPQTPFVATGPRGMWDENLMVVTTSAMQEVGDEIFIYYFGCPNVYTNWPGQYAATSELRGSFYYPSYLGVATLLRDRYAYAAGPGSVTTPAVSVGEQGLWLNADGAGLSIAALASDGTVVANGKLADSPKGSLYRKVQWKNGPPRQPCQLKITLADKDRIYSIRY